MGSIKAYKAARENARNHVNLQQSSYNEDSNDDDSVDEQLEAKQKQNKNGKAIVIYSGGTSHIFCQITA